MVVVPISAVITETYVAKAVVDAAVISDVATPITAVITIAAAVESPVARGPQSPLVRRVDPRTGNPIIAITGVSPVAGGPDIVIAGSRGLLVTRLPPLPRHLIQVRLRPRLHPGVQLLHATRAIQVTP